MQEYVLHHEERPKVQWYLKDASLEKLLEAQVDDEDETLIRLRKVNDVVKSLFSQVVQNHLAHVDGNPNSAVIQEREDRLTGQIMIRLESMIADASTLSERSRLSVLKAQGREAMAVMIFTAVILIMFAVSILVTFKTILPPLARLRVGAKRIGAGDFSLRLDDSGRDEIGDLARVFNDMAEALKGRDMKIRRLVDSSIIGVVTSELEGRVIEANDAFLELVGYDRSDLNDGRVDWKRITPPEFQASDIQALQELKEKGTYAPFEKEFLHKDSRRIPVMIGGALVEGSPASTVSFVMDLSERRAAQDALAETQAKLAHVARISSLGALTASVAHEVNQPLAGIVTNASTCLRMLAANPPNINGAIETARRTLRDGNRASAVVKRLRLLFARNNSEMEAVDLNDAASEVMVLLEGELNRKRAIVRTEFAGDLPLVIGDRVQLQQVVLNLVVNAAEAMIGVDHRPRQLVVRTQQLDSDHVSLAVQDAGMGFDLQSAESLFDAFYTTKPGGMGIGLFVSRAIIAGHGGRIWASANDQPGATFSFVLPCEVINSRIA
jgi:PAS domain S-box-containing protein